MFIFFYNWAVLDSCHDSYLSLQLPTISARLLCVSAIGWRLTALLRTRTTLRTGTWIPKSTVPTELYNQKQKKHTTCSSQNIFLFNFFFNFFIIFKQNMMQKKFVYVQASVENKRKQSEHLIVLCFGWILLSLCLFAHVRRLYAWEVAAVLLSPVFCFHSQFLTIPGQSNMYIFNSTLALVWGGYLFLGLYLSSWKDSFR